MAEATRVKVSAREVETIPVKVGESVIVDAVFLDVNDNTAPVDGLPMWTSTNPAVLAVTNPTASSCEVDALQPGEAEVVCYADADMSAGVRNIAGRLAFAVSQLEAERVVLTPR